MYTPLDTEKEGQPANGNTSQADPTAHDLSRAMQPPQNHPVGEIQPPQDSGKDGEPSNEDTSHPDSTTGHEPSGAAAMPPDTMIAAEVDGPTNEALIERLRQFEAQMAALLTRASPDDAPPGWLF
ncbi:hypothetical protein B0H17DRAFT_1191580 [Mycena rosella]|uniref:Uncharacterized protein n=1 Tax=Mycena rosella TaxID=1033263 RepID=A0AAD7GYD5_MYCRO|nr:hypothetical protein B0H17DRAFT_1191580 [Mycena rosella]